MDLRRPLHRDASGAEPGDDAPPGLRGPLDLPIDPALVHSLETTPLTRPEYINAMVHFYRAEMHRSQVWRMRLDTTTNWAVVTLAAMTSFAFSDPGHSHFILLLSNLMITAFLTFEARRYRYFTVYRGRVRMLEENFFIPIIRRSLVSPREDWRERVAKDLDQPKFKITFMQSVGFRLRRNYVWIFGVLLITWIVKLFIHPAPADSMRELIGRIAIGPISPFAILFACGVFYAYLAAAVWTTVGANAPADEIQGVESALDHWKV